MAILLNNKGTEGKAQKSDGWQVHGLNIRCEAIGSWTRQPRGYKGDYLFMLLAGTPPIPPRVFKIMGNFGSRLFFLSLHTPDEDEELIAQNQGTNRKLKENECKRVTETFLRSLCATNLEGVEWNKSGDPDDCLRVLARCTRLLAALRGAINVWHNDEGGEKLSHNVPVIEKPHRINCLLYNLARAHALVRGRRQLTTDDLWPVLDITFDSAPTPFLAQVCSLQAVPSPSVSPQ